MRLLHCLSHLQFRNIMRPRTLIDQLFTAPTNPAAFSPPLVLPPSSAGMGQSFPAAGSMNLPPVPPSSLPTIPANNTIASQPRPSHPPSSSNNNPQFAAQATAQAQATASLDKARVATLLDINTILLQEVVNLQAAGKTGSQPSQPSGQESQSHLSPKSEHAHEPQTPKIPGPVQKSSPEYIECMRRLQVNLSFLASIADRAKKPGFVSPPQAPAVMTAPPNVPQLNDLYVKLNELFPRGPAAGTQQAAIMQGGGHSSPSLVSESNI